MVVPVSVRDDAGNLLAQYTIPMSANGEFLGDLGPNLFPATVNIRGTLEFDTPARRTDRRHRRPHSAHRDLHYASAFGEVK